ncbi:unnamed protein product [Polarella glacialis]|uniref:Uncharacterized protein n=1 Tax=Polarella glacialis TaxID=89957 RepID=A0A813J022_POLGL|nr:unnamed protein product [Polarella glacialis]
MSGMMGGPGMPGGGGDGQGGEGGGMGGGMPGMPGMMPGMRPGMPGMMPGMTMPGMRPGMPGMPGMPGGMPGMPGGGMPGMPGGGMPGMPGGGMPGMPGGGMPGMQGGCNPMMMMMMANMMKMAQMNQGGGAGRDAPANPMAAMMAQMQQAQGGGAMSSAGGGGGSSAPAKKESRSEPEGDAAIDPEIRELGDYFNIEERWIKRLNETMLKRQDTKGQDLEKLYEVLERARSPTGLLTVQIGKMECGQFVGKIKPDKDVERLARKFKLDDHVTSRLTELKVCRRTSGQEERGIKDLDRLEQHLRYCKRPNAMATLLAGKLLEGEMEELPDLTEAEKIMEKYKLDEDARSKLREIVEKRAADATAVLEVVKKHLDTSTFASSMLCKIARTLIDGETLPDPPERHFKSCVSRVVAFCSCRFGRRLLFVHLLFGFASDYGCSC